MVGGIGDFCLFIVIKKKDLSTYNNRLVCHERRRATGIIWTIVTKNYLSVS